MKRKLATICAMSLLILVSNSLQPATLKDTNNYNDLYITTYRQVKSPKYKSVTQDTRLSELAQKLGINVQDVGLFYDINISKQATDYRGTQKIEGVFLSPDTISINFDTSRREQLRVLAHEFLHYKWQNYSLSDKTRISSNLTFFSEHSTALTNATANYIGDPETIYDEQFAIYCTEIKDFNPVLLSYCDNSIKNRQILFI